MLSKTTPDDLTTFGWDGANRLSSIDHPTLGHYEEKYRFDGLRDGQLLPSGDFVRTLWDGSVPIQTVVEGGTTTTPLLGTPSLGAPPASSGGSAPASAPVVNSGIGTVGSSSLSDLLVQNPSGNNLLHETTFTSAY
jgi:hypothetical protein